MSKKTLIMFCGSVASGKTTSCSAVKTYLDSVGIGYTLISRGTAPSKLGITLYEWANDINNNPVLLIDTNTEDVFTRAEMFDVIKSLTNPAMDTICKIAIRHERSNRFMVEHNRDKTRANQLTYNQIYSHFRRYQQPILKEGFDFIYDVSTDEYLNVNNLLFVTSKKAPDSSLVSTYNPIPEGAMASDSAAIGTIDLETGKTIVKSIEFDDNVEVNVNADNAYTAKNEA